MSKEDELVEWKLELSNSRAKYQAARAELEKAIVEHNAAQAAYWAVELCGWQADCDNAETNIKRLWAEQKEVAR